MKRFACSIAALLLGFAAFANLARAQWASEPGFAVIQQQCMKCHGKASMPQAPGLAALREFSGNVAHSNKSGDEEG